MKVAIVYDRVNKWGGAERVLLALHKLFPNAPLYTSVHNNTSAPWSKVFTVIPSFLQNFPFAKNSHELYPLLMPIAFESFSFDKYDLVISVTSESAKGIITKPHTKHICYLLTPTRYLWSGYKNYFKNEYVRFLSYPLIWYLRTWDIIASKRPDAYIAISKEVQKRIKKYYNEESLLLYPPVYSNLAKMKNKIKGVESQKPYFLIVSRLVDYKRIDIAIEACNELALPLKIVGIGSSEQALRNIAGSTIEFLGSLTDDELIRYYKGCKALLFPGHEDFGLTVIEAHLFGKPVIAYKKGGALETINEGKTGEFFYPQTKSALIDTIRYFMSKTYDAQSCKKQASLFNEKKFNSELLRIIGEFI